MGEKAVKIFGMERTCTNYVRELIERNYSLTVWVNTFGGKHALVDPEGWVLTGNWQWRHTYENSTARFVICVKDPYHWLESIRRYCSDEPYYIAYDPERLLKRFERMYLHWHEELIANGHAFFNEGGIVKYEELLLNPASAIGKVMGLTKEGEFIGVNVVRHSERFTDERKKYYLNRVEDEVIIRLVNENISDEFFIKYGYERIG